MVNKRSVLTPTLIAIVGFLTVCPVVMLIFGSFSTGLGAFGKFTLDKYILGYTDPELHQLHPYRGTNRPVESTQHLSHRRTVKVFRGSGHIHNGFALLGKMFQFLQYFTPEITVIHQVMSFINDHDIFRSVNFTINNP